jgi:ribonucleoside-diphosphate reductase alpha chain
VKEDAPWQLIFPYTAKEVEQDGIALDDPARWSGDWPNKEGW